MKTKPSRDALIFFCRYPSPGKVKTRLAAAVGPRAAAALYAASLLDLKAAVSASGADVFVFHTPPASDGARLRRLLGLRAIYLPQNGLDLGERLRNAFIHVFKAGYEKAVVIGSDSPDLGSGPLCTAFRTLGRAGAVIGPAADGGYYLFGFRRERFAAEVFDCIPWGGARVFQNTLRRCAAVGVKPRRLKEWYDLDILSDLHSFCARNLKGKKKSHTLKIALKLLADVDNSNENAEKKRR